MTLHFLPRTSLALLCNHFTILVTGVLIFSLCPIKSNNWYREIAEKLERESGLHTRSSNVDNLFSAISGGNWSLAVELVDGVDFVSKTPQAVKAMILELKYMEMIQSGDVVNALHCLRNELRDVCDINRYAFISYALI
jgi:hypothetical protein